MPVAVVDTQVWVSGLLNSTGAAAKVIRAFETAFFALAVTESIFDEYSRVLRCFTARLGEEPVDEVLGAIRKTALFVVPVEWPLVCRDETDNKFVECAVAAEADFLVTKNLKHFPRQFGDTKVVRISTFLRALGI